MSDINFCPFCDTSAHKIVEIQENFLFCKECNRFYRIDELRFKCKKCQGEDIIDSEFPNPDGQIVFQCKKCKKMMPAKEFFDYSLNKQILDKALQ